mgnify:CR=1 FL=1
MQLSATHGVAEPLSLDGHPQTSGPHSGFAIAIPVNFLLVRFVSKEKSDNLFSPDFLRILQKDLFYDGNSPILAVVVPCIQMKRQCCMKPIND